MTVLIIVSLVTLILIISIVALVYYVCSRKRSASLSNDEEMELKKQLEPMTSDSSDEVYWYD